MKKRKKSLVGWIPELNMRDFKNMFDSVGTCVIHPHKTKYEIWYPIKVRITIEEL